MRVWRERVGRGLVAGVVAAGATAGTLLGLGRARGAAFALLNDAAHILIGSRALSVDTFSAQVTGLAMLVHLASLLLWGVLFALLAGGLRGWRLAIAAVLFAGGALALDVLVLPPSLRPGFETAMTAGELALLYAVLAAALAIGVREARSAIVA
jgi:hypothetical protein